MATSTMIALGSPDYRRAAIAMCASGFATFALLYCVQPLMPVFSERFGLSAAQASLSLAVATGVLTVSIFAASVVSERFGRKRVMTVSMFGSSVLNLACSLAPGWDTLLGMRLLEGVVAGGVPAVGMAYLAEEMEPRGLSLAMGIYVAGNAFGGMLGRLLTGAIADVAGWRVAMAALGGLGLIASVAFVALLPASRNFSGGVQRDAAHHVAVFARLFRVPRLRLLFALGLLIAGPFVCVYNYSGYRLSAPPYGLSQTGIGLIFLVYIFGIVGSTVFGRFADRFGRGRILLVAPPVMLVGTALTALHPLWWIIAGVATVTFGFFGAHTVASAWVGALGRGTKGHAAALYLFFFYLGFSVLGLMGGFAWQHAAWPGVAWFCAAVSIAAFGVAWRAAPSRRGVSRDG